MENVDLQKDFNQWAVKNGIENTVAFKAEHQLAYKKNHSIHIKKDDEQLILRNEGGNLSVKYVQDLERVKSKLTDDDLTELLKGNSVNKIKSFTGTVIDVKDDKITLENDKFGRMDFNTTNRERFKIGEEVEAKAFISTKETKAGEGYNVEDFSFRKKDEHSKTEFSNYEIDEYMQVHEVNPDDIVKNIQRINSQDLTAKQKVDLVKGKSIYLEEEEEEVKISPKETKGVSSKYLMLVGSLAIDGGMSYFLYKGSNFAKRQLKNYEQKKLEKNTEKLKQAFKQEQIKNPENASLQKEFKKYKDFTDARQRDTDDFSSLKIQAKTFDLSQGKEINRGLAQNQDIGNLYQTLKSNFDKNPNDLISVKINTKNDKQIASFDITKDSPILDSKEIFESYLNTKNANLFYDKTRSNDNLHEIVEKNNSIVKQEDFAKRIENDRHNIFENYLVSLKSIALQKARAYPENKTIRDDINILDKNISLINNTSFQNRKDQGETISKNQKGSATGTNDPDVFQDALADEKKEELKKEKKFFQDWDGEDGISSSQKVKKQVSRGRKL